MFREGDLISAERIDESIRQMICTSLEATEDEISYFFVEYDGDYSVLSVETDRRYAIIHCPTDRIDHMADYSYEAEWLIDQLVRESYLDHALETRNEALFEAVMEYRQTPEPKRPVEEKPESRLYYEGVYDLEDGEFLFDDDMDFGSDEYWKYYGGE